MDIFIKKGIVSQAQSSIILGSGVNLERFKPSLNSENSDSLNFGLASRMLWSKGVREFINAGKSLLNSGYKAEFHVIGSPDKYNPDFLNKKKLPKNSVVLLAVKKKRPSKMPKNHVELRFKRTSIISILVVNEFADLDITSKSSHDAPSSLSSSPNSVVVKKMWTF